MERCAFTYGCTKESVHAGRCNGHYQRFHRDGVDKPDPPKMPARFWRFVEKSDTCWTWTGAKVRGYGYFRLEGKQRKAHRVSYELLVGPISEGLTLDHLCQNKGCVNPQHLEPVTSGENARRQARGMTACRREGHPFDEGNTWIDKRGRRVCRACRRKATFDWWHKQHPNAGYRE
jgi:HNH endonuclease